MKIQLIIWTVIAVALTACSNTNNKISQQPDSSIAFLNLFTDTTFDNLHLYSPCDKVDGKKYEGKLIDSTFYNFFAFDDVLKYDLDNKSKIFSCHKFKLSDTKTGLIVRTPSQYDATSIDLCIWDNHSKKIIKRIELADAFGDGQWYFVQDGWLTDINHDKQLDLIIRKTDWWEEDTEADSTNVGKEHSTDSIKVFIANGDSYKFSKVTVDTAKFKLLDSE